MVGGDLAGTPINSPIDLPIERMTNAVIKSRGSLKTKSIDRRALDCHYGRYVYWVCHEIGPLERYGELKEIEI